MDLVPKPNYQPFEVGIQVDTSQVLKALDLATKSTTRKLTKLLKDTAISTAFKAQEETKGIALGWIDARMEVDVISYTNAGRTRISRAKRGTAFTRTPANPFLPAKAVPLGVLIVMARHRPGSRWNLMTDSRWALTQPLPSGTGRGAARQQQIADELTRMIRGRRSSANFLKHGWTSVIQDLRKIGVRGDGFIDVEAEVIPDGQSPLGRATASQGETSMTPWVKIENMVGKDPSHSNLELRRQYYLFAVGGLALEAAFLKQVAEMQAHYLPKVGGELAAEWNAL